MFSALLGLTLLTAQPVYACAMQDAAAFQEAATKVRASEGTQVAFNVEGMTCGDCSTKLGKALSEVEGVTAAAVDYQTGEALIAFNSDKVDAAALLKVIEKNGYAAKKTS